MQITIEILEANREALTKERDEHLAAAERASAQATAVGGALRILEHLIEVARKPEGDE